MKPKKKVRKSGYYVVHYGIRTETIAKYYSDTKIFVIIGSTDSFDGSFFSYISPTPITIPKRKK